MQNIKLVYLTGMWRSGGTVLGRILDCSKQIIFVGNLKDFWRKGLKRNNKCSCGERFENCSFWKEVTKEYRKSFPSDNFEELNKKFQQIEKWSNFFELKKIVLNKKESFLKPALYKYTEHNEKLYKIISNLSGKKIIVDSSRNTGRLLALSLINNLELFPINIIRDPRGVLNSLINKDISNYKEIRHSSILNLLQWNIKNYFSVDIMKKLNTSGGMYVLYKNFSSCSSELVEKLKTIFNCELNYNLDNGKFSIIVETGHLFSGNRKRHTSGKITIKEDIEWKEELSLLHKALTFIISLPLFKYILKKCKINSDGITIYSAKQNKFNKILAIDN